MPVAITLRSVPLVAMTPLIALIFGRGVVGVTVVVGIVTFFPTLVNVAVGLRSAPELACDLVRASGGSRLMVVRKVQLLYALPAFSPRPGSRDRPRLAGRFWRSGSRPGRVWVTCLPSPTVLLISTSFGRAPC